MQLFCMCHRVLPSESLISQNISSPNDHELSEWPWKQIKTKQGYALSTSPKWGPEHIKQGIPHKEKNINIVGICGKHKQYGSSPLKIKEHKLAEVQRRGMKKAKLDGWCQRLGGAGFIRPGITVFDHCDDRWSTQHTMASLAILGTRAAASYYSRNTAKGCCRQCCIHICGSGPLV